MIDPDSPATSAAPLANRAVGRRRLRLVQRVQRFLVAAALLLTAAAWAKILELDDDPWLAAIPVLIAVSAVPVVVAGSAVAVFARGLWAIVAVRAALWGSFVCGAVVTVTDRHEIEGLLIALPAGIGLLCLGRFSRAFGGARPLLVALVVFAVSDALVHGIIATYVMVDGLREGEVFIVCGFAALANVVGLACILRLRSAWPHIAGNAVVVVLVCLDVMDAPIEISGPMVGAALLQITIAFMQRMPRLPSRTRRAAEVSLRVAIALALATLIALSMW